MNQSEVIDTLKKEATLNPAANAVFHVLALRKRARNTVTLRALSQKMKKEGFSFPDNQYINLIQLMAKVGLGRLDTDPKGKVRGIKDVRATLQSIGAAACGQEPSLSGFKPRNRFTTLASEISKAVAIDAPPKTQETPGVTLKVYLKDKPIEVPVPENLTCEEIALLVSKLQTL